MPYISHFEKDTKQMLAELGAASIDELFQDIPPNLRLATPLDLPPPLCEMELARHMETLAKRNLDLGKVPIFLGAGAYDHFIPAAVDHLAARAEFVTAYTPYQAEASQGILQAFFEYQTCICLLTGMEVSNASMYDGSTALAEACAMALRITGRRSIVLPRSIHPAYRATLTTYLSRFASLIEIPFSPQGRTTPESIREAIGDDCACVVVQQPNFFGCLEDTDAISEGVHARGALLVACVDPSSLGILKPPGEYGADIVVGDGQSLGNHLAYGGPHFGFFACRKRDVRRMPGRIVGETVDREGHRAFTLTLQTREQHIRREKATSNICTNHGLCALRGLFYLAIMGESGLRRVAELCMEKSLYAFEQICKLPGFAPRFDGPFFREFVVRTPRAPDQINSALLEMGIIGGFELGRFYPEMSDCMMFAVTEKRTHEEIDRLVAALREAAGRSS